MKKFFLSILTMLYLTVSSGIAMEIHYCMGKKAGVDIYNTAAGKCSRCGMKEKKGGCCSDEHKFYKLAAAHKHVSNDITTYLSVYTILIEQRYFSVVCFPAAIPPPLKRIIPPADPGPPIFLRNAVFRI